MEQSLAILCSDARPAHLKGFPPRPQGDVDAPAKGIPGWQSKKHRGAGVLLSPHVCYIVVVGLLAVGLCALHLKCVRLEQTARDNRNQIEHLNDVVKTLVLQQKMRQDSVPEERTSARNEDISFRQGNTEFQAPNDNNKRSESERKRREIIFAAPSSDPRVSQKRKTRRGKGRKKCRKDPKAPGCAPGPNGVVSAPPMSVLGPQGPPGLPGLAGVRGPPGLPGKCSCSGNVNVRSKSMADSPAGVTSHHQQNHHFQSAHVALQHSNHQHYFTMDDPVFLWDDNSPPLTHNFFSFPEDRYIHITVSGTYYVYSQMTYYYRPDNFNESHSASLGHRTVRIPCYQEHGDCEEKATLMESVHTPKVELGPHGTPISDVESRYHGGVFELWVHDRIQVEPLSSRHDYMIAREQAFFGAFFLAPAPPGDDGESPRK